MVTNALIDLVTFVLAPIINALFPHLSLTGFTNFSTDAASTLAGYLGAMTPFFPVTFTLTILQVFVVMLPAIGAYVVFQWVWDHIPSIAGFGTA